MSGGKCGQDDQLRGKQMKAAEEVDITLKSKYYFKYQQKIVLNNNIYFVCLDLL